MESKINWKNILIGVIIGAILVGLVGITFWYFTRPKESETSPVTTTKTSTSSAKPAASSAKSDEKLDQSLILKQVSFTNSQGKSKKFIIYKIAGETSDYPWPKADTYIVDEYLSKNTAVKISQLSSPTYNLGETLSVGEVLIYVSAGPGKKFIIITTKIAEGFAAFLLDEDGREIKIDFSKMGLGTKIPGMYNLSFGQWVGNSTQFTITAVSGNNHSYEATFEATTGKQVGETRETG
ncbi:MAG: hypothetical protein A2126_03215 [Candidatus Woykebacteria bacterium GWB1_45_5]|uniref:Uncharacterized protein n=2 Tax=Candidatus Woykeibacteriota TaxID=1817899 RepID=A0A1G1W229_9BACT|nr:MAG: hypothetical protein A2113_03710 [Candidatus Woykebacteria bacterium GWA1_44_8]OGY23587.1 MAG: hypothetical protein A2126_03215 [Candidatus Woykebacteria bacterium GWB1_45_5]